MAPAWNLLTFPFIDLLMHAQENRAYFDVDINEDYVPLYYDYELVTQPILYNADDINKRLFVKGDNLYILSLGVQLPLSFELWPDRGAGFPNSLRLGYKTFSGDYTITAQNRLYLPFANYELNLGSFLKMLFPQEDFCLCLDLEGLQPATQDIDRPKISMINVPTSLNAMRFYCPCFVKVAHTIEMKSLPPA